jgi:hypothetical protein
VGLAGDETKTPVKLLDGRLHRTDGFDRPCTHTPSTSMFLILSMSSGVSSVFSPRSTMPLVFTTGFAVFIPGSRLPGAIFGTTILLDGISAKGRKT